MTRWTKAKFSPDLARVERGSVVLDCHLLDSEVAVHRNAIWTSEQHHIGKSWCVSHFRSGKLLGSRYFKRLRDAKAYAERIHALEPTIWAQELPNISHLIESCRKVCAEFAHCPT